MRLLQFCHLLSFLFILSSAQQANAALAPGHLDPDFGNAGKQTVALALHTALDKNATSMAIGPQGHPYLVGTVRLDSQQLAIGITRVLPNGDADNDFGVVTLLPTGLSSVVVQDAIFQSDGRLVVVGQAPTELGSGFFACRFAADGSVDIGFGDPATPGCRVAGPGSGNAAARSVVIQGSGRIVMGGFATIDGIATGALLALDGQGNVDPTFGVFGVSAVPQTFNNGNVQTLFTDIALGADGSLAVAGHSVSAQNERQFLVGRLDANGMAVTSFALDGYYSYNFGFEGYAEANAVQLLDDGAVLTAGFVVLDDTGIVAPAIIKNDANGDLVAGFSDGGKLVPAICGGTCDARGHDLKILPDGQILLAGSIIDFDESEPADQQIHRKDFFVLRLLANGEPDPGFGSPDSSQPGMARVSFDLVDGLSEDAGFRLAADGDTLLVSGYARAPGADDDAYDLAIARLGNATGMFADGFE